MLKRVNIDTDQTYFISRFIMWHRDNPVAIMRKLSKVSINKVTNSSEDDDLLILSLAHSNHAWSKSFPILGYDKPIKPSLIKEEYKHVSHTNDYPIYPIDSYDTVIHQSD